ncbi:MAG: flavin reductase [Gammaproteobacteria bacterium]|nr:flavin reductase [Gammaproteobacteria bacterium]
MPPPYKVQEYPANSRGDSGQNCLAWFECDELKRVQVHDHTLFVAQVRACENEDGIRLMF